MKTLLIAAIVIVALLPFLFSRNRKGSPAQETAKGRETYAGLRNMILTGSRTKFSLPETSRPTEPWGAVMDWGVQSGTATVVALSDGTASVYVSGGGGYIGGIGQEPIRAAAKKAIEIARSIQLPQRPTTDFPLPETHGVVFYFLSDAGVFVVHSSEQELNSPSHPLRRIGDAMQGIITEYRLWDQAGTKGGGGTLVR